MREGLTFCWCGMWLRPDEDTIRKNEARYKTLIVPHYLARINRSTGKKVRWNPKAKRSLESEGRHTRAAIKNGKDTSQSGGNRMSSTENRRWPTDGLRSTLKTIDVEYTATWGQRHRYESTVTLDMTTKDRQCGPMNRRSDYKPTTHACSPQSSTRTKKTKFRNAEKWEMMKHQSEGSEQDSKLGLCLTILPE